MRKSILLMAVGLLLGIASMAQNTPENKSVEEAIMQFAAAADAQNVAVLDGLLDANFRILMNQLFGSADVVVMDKATYLSKIRNKEYGGQKRDVTIGQIMLNGNTAQAKVTFKGSKLTFVSLLQFVRTNSGAWKVIGDMPVIP